MRGPRWIPSISKATYGKREDTETKDKVSRQLSFDRHKRASTIGYRKQLQPERVGLVQASVCLQECFRNERGSII